MDIQFMRKKIIPLFCCCFLWCYGVWAQQQAAEKPQQTKAREKAAADSLKKTQSVVKTTVFSSAADSMNFNFFTQTTYLYGNAKVTYGEQEITAAVIELKRLKNTVKAYGVVDSAGNLVGLPVFKDGETTYNAEEITYNYETKKGIIRKIITKQNDGFVRGEKVKKTPDNELYLKRAIYTTCNLAEPHYAIRAGKLKLVPGKYVVCGPFHMELNRVPTPIGFVLGMFPFTDRRTSGIIMPNYGESYERGFFLRGGGLYLAVNDYIGMKLTGEIYSLGGWGASLDTEYRKRYKYSGSLNLRYRNVQRQNDDLSKSVTSDYWLSWRHAPQSRGSSRFSASVNAGSSSYNCNNALSVSSFVAPTFNSSINYSKTLEGTPFSFSSDLRHSQNTITEIVTLTPTARLSMRSIFPFAKLMKGKNTLSQLSVSYSGSLRGKLTNNPSDWEYRFPFKKIVGQPDKADVKPDTVNFFEEFGTVARHFQYGMQHRIPVSTSLTLLKHFHLSPSFNYNEEWYPNRFRYTWVDSLKAVAVDTISKLSRSYNFNFSTSLNTKMYAFYYLKGGITIRQMISPSVSYQYTPDFGDDRYGFFQEVQTDEKGNRTKVPIFQGSGVPQQGRSSTMSFSLGNQFEIKVKSKKDTTVKDVKMPLLENLSVNSSYNFALDSFQLGNFSLSARTTILKKLGISMSGTLDPYTYAPQSYDKETGQAVGALRRTPLYAWQGEGKLGHLTQTTISFDTNISPQDFKKKNKRTTTETPKTGENTSEETASAGEHKLNPMEAAELRQIRQNPQRYVDFKLPWSLGINYSLNYSKPPGQDAKIVQTLNFRGDLSLTEKWKITASSGYDFEKKEFSFTNFSIHRDLHCWQMALSWVPFGQRKSYSIDIRVKSSILQDLKLSKRNSWFDR